MARTPKLNERAAVSGGAALWHVDRGWSLFAGPLGHNDRHAHSAAVYLVGLYDAFRLRVGAGPWRTCRAAVVRAGTPYEFDAGQSPLGVLYLEPDKGRAETLAALMRQADESDGALVGDGDTAHIRRLFEQRPGIDALRAAGDDLLAFARGRARRDGDARIRRAIEFLQRDGPDLAPASEVAAAAGLSSSRFQHLFTAEVGVPFRHYRGWQRLRRAIRVAAGGATLTDAAHAAGFADQAHFCRAFRAAFGAPPSRGL